MKNRLNKILIISLVGIVLSFFLTIVLVTFDAEPVFAQQGNTIVQTTETVGAATGLGNEDPRIIVARVIRVFLTLLGAIALIMIIYAGFLYMTSGGDPGKTDKAKKILINTVIGLLIIISSYAIVSYIIGALEDSFGIGGGTQEYEYTAPGLNSGGLGRVLQDHFPSVGMTVPRNTVIMATFMEPIWPASIITPDTLVCKNLLDDTEICSGASCAQGTVVPDNNIVCSGMLDKNAIKVYRACDSIYPVGSVSPSTYEDANRNIPNVCNEWRGDPPSDDLLIGGDDNVEISVVPDFKTFVFNPYGLSVDQHLGSPLTDTEYMVQLTNNIINLERGTGAFTSDVSKSYSWNFTTNTEIDTTPPFITGIYPVELDASGQPVAVSDGEDNNGYPRNTRIRVDFSEAIIPPVYLNITSKDLNANANLNAEMIILDSVENEAVLGNFVAGINRYKSVIFKSTEECGASMPKFNSCGDLITCLPGNTTIEGLVRSVSPGSLINGVGPTASLFPAGGMVDTALNALDTDGIIGLGNGSTDGVVDNFDWSFNTSDEVDLESPKVTAVTPVLQADNLHGSAPTMDDPTQIGVTPESLVTAYFSKALDPSTTINGNMMIVSDFWDGWYSGGLFCEEKVAADGSDFCVVDDDRVMIYHSGFSIAKDETEVPLFYPKLTSGIQDMNGNCFNPTGDGAAGQVGATCNGLALPKGKSCCATYPDGYEIVDGESCPF